MENTRLQLVGFVSAVLFAVIIDYAFCKQFSKINKDPPQTIDKVEPTTPHPDYSDVDFENRRESSWSGTKDPDPDLPVDKINCADGEWDDLAYEESIKFHLDQESCDLNILGSKAEKCSAEIVCTDLNFKEPKGKKCQLDSYLKITDALGGSMTACGKMEFGGPYRASKNGRDLYVSYRGPSNGTVCQVICGQDRKVPEYTPLLNVLTRNREKSCSCGIKPEIQGRIVGGKDATPFEFPWLAALAYSTTRLQFCGGSLINDRYVLTAAHCFHNSGVRPQDIDILLHAHILDLNKNSDYKKDAKAGEPGSIQEVPGLDQKVFTDEDEETVRLEVEDIFVHPLWSFRALDYDIALIKLKTPLNLKDTRLYNPVCLPPEGKYFGYANRTATVAGWGKPHETAGAASRTCQKANMPVLFSKTCRRIVDSDSRNMTARMLCAGYMEGGIDSCGDSGGPLTFKFNEHQHRQIGVVSFGEGCSRAANPGVYANVQEIIQWIFFMTDDAIWCQDIVQKSKTTSVPIHVTTELTNEDV